MKTNIYTERKSKDLPVFDIVIVGSGLGGLTVASLLCRRGYSVCVLEQHDQAGGCLHTFAEKGYEFDVGLHYIGGDVGNKWSPLRKAFDAVTGGRVEWCKMEVRRGGRGASEGSERRQRAKAASEGGEQPNVASYPRHANFAPRRSSPLLSANIRNPTTRLFAAESTNQPRRSPFTVTTIAPGTS